MQFEKRKRKAKSSWVRIIAKHIYGFVERCHQRTISLVSSALDGADYYVVSLVCESISYSFSFTNSSVLSNVDFDSFSYCDNV